MTPHPHYQKKSTLAPEKYAQAAIKKGAIGAPIARPKPLGAMLLMGSLAGIAAQPSWGQDITTLPPVVVTGQAERQEGKDSVRATHSTIGKTQQALRDIPQSVTVVTEKLVDDRQLDTLKEVLHNTAGVSFQAAEGGEEDIRLRGFSLATSGDIFLDGVRDPAFYDRDTFNNERIELLRGSASMLFGRGSTGGVVNQVSKQPRAQDEKAQENEISTTLGSYQYRRVTGDFTLHTGEDSALRINAMATKADNNGAGSRIDKKGIAASYRFGMETDDDVTLSVYALDNNNGINYGMPWIRPTASANVSTATIISQLSPSAYYGMASDYNRGTAQHLTASHTHRFEDDSSLKTTLRKGRYTRDQRAGTVRLATGTGLDNFSDSTVLRRGNNAKIQDLDGLYAQSDYSTGFNAWGMHHEVLAGIDMAQESKNVYAASAVTKPTTLVGTPDDGAWIDEAARTVTRSSAFTADNLGLYVQDMLHMAPQWKLVGGLRFDRMRANFDTLDTAGNITGSYAQTISDWSKRIGLLYQPDARHSYHLSYGTSFNTSADTYSFAGNASQRALAANTPPEQSRNIEIGAKLESADQRLSTRIALFQSTKYNERNTDPDSAATQFLLSGQRHTTGLELDIAGRITERWEIYVSYMWMPDAMIDVSNATNNGAREGERPGLTPIHSGTVWSTYQFTPALRLGAGLNARSEQAPSTNPGFMAPGYVTLDLMGEYKLNTQYLLKANITNVMDTRYADALYTGHYIPGSGRTLQLTLTARF